MGTRMRDLKHEGCDAVVLIGQVLRQDARGLDLDDGGMAMLPDILAAAPNGDDALLRVLVEHHEKAGFRVIGVEEAMADLLATRGVWGMHAPSEVQRKDIAKAARIAAALGAYDVGQGVVVCEGLPLAVEAQEGTDRMLARVAELPIDVRGSASSRKGVLVKRPKPIQERRIDLPTIGVRTVEGAALAGLAGIAVEAGGALAVRRPEIIVAADQLGLFLYGFTPAEVDVV
jgi:hypothetical protein